MITASSELTVEICATPCKTLLEIYLYCTAIPKLDRSLVAIFCYIYTPLGCLKHEINHIISSDIHYVYGSQNNCRYRSAETFRKVYNEAD